VGHVAGEGRSSLVLCCFQGETVCASAGRERPLWAASSSASTSAPPASSSVCSSSCLGTGAGKRRCSLQCSHTLSCSNTPLSGVSVCIPGPAVFIGYLDNPAPLMNDSVLFSLE